MTQEKKLTDRKEKQTEKKLGETNDFLLGGIAIPKLNKTLKIYEIAEEPYITNGVGLDVPGRIMGKDNVVLASHDYDETFGNLVNLTIGDMVYTTDETNIYTFEVTEHFQAKDDDVQDIKKVRENKDQPIITLYTCFGGQGTDIRTVIQGILKEVKPIDSSDTTIRQLFTSSIR